MLDLVVTPNYLDRLATIENQASDKIGSAAGATNGVSSDVWLTHGVASEPSNIALTRAEAARRSAIEAMQSVCKDLAVKLGAAADAYSKTDEQAGGNIDKQLLAG
ncbi:ESX-1 secretion-associated protein [Mycobacterium sp. Aquia_213]|uniref:ESX-1 secretion-associated protein n=1 Tax=Mycobacterium sp. Aquia_213 TaxID=2991728 RepID=UPI00226DC8DF|nr:ESX-1 secretion-associated protein [Mycobacterium sp. Aquia_213]WAC93300.1 ESX-1 secretion-associated protein [Mycobacterium sp. Aquia_213]